MNNGLKKSVTQSKNGKNVRPVLLVSDEVVDRFSIVLQRLLTGLANESLAMAVVCSPGCDTDFALSPVVEIISHPAYSLPLLWCRNRRALIENIQMFKPTIIHSLDEKGAPLAKRLSEEFNVPFVVSINLLKKKYPKLNAGAINCAAIITPTGKIADNVQNICEKFTTDVEPVKPGCFVKDSRACFSVQGRTASIVLVSDFDDAVSFAPLLKAFRHLMIDGYEFVVVIIGSGRAEQQVRRMINDNGLAQVVNVVGKIEPLRSVFMGADILVQHKPLTRFNQYVLEAMGVGLVVASCGGGVDDFVIDGETAVIFDGDDELKVYACLQKLLDQRQYAREIADAGQEFVSANHSTSAMVDAVMEIYRQAQRRFMGNG